MPRHLKTTERLKVLSLVRFGLSVRQACRIIPISVPCISQWKKKSPEFAEQLKQARQEGMNSIYKNKVLTDEQVNFLTKVSSN